MVETVKKRDYYLDFLRGIAAINIIIIHTAFWSGGGYVPMEIQSLTLLLDVPFFFFLAGWSRAFNPSFARTIKSLLDLYGKYVFFITIYFIFLLIIGEKVGGANNYLAHLAFLEYQPTKFYVIMGSIWFMPVYYAVLPFCMIVISSINEKSGNLKEKHILYFFLICLILFMWSMLGRGYYFLSREILFYSMFFLLGYIFKDKYIKHISSLVVLIGITFGLAYIFAVACCVDITNLQALKFPPHIVYFLLSLIVILLAVYFKGKVNIREKNPFVWVGKNAIWFYFGQGISSTLIYHFVATLQCSWYIKLPICIVANIILALGVVIVVKNLYVFLTKTIRLVKGVIISRSSF